MQIKIEPKYFNYALLGYMLLIFIESSIPGDRLPKTEFEFGDKIIHFLVYSVLCLLFFYSLKNQSKYVKLLKFAPEFSLMFTSLYGITDEIHQYFVPNRSCELYDWLADTAGALSVYIILRFSNVLKKEIVCLILPLFFINCTSSKSTSDDDTAAFSFTETEVWLNLMPVVDENKNNFGFVISLNIESEGKPEDFGIRNFKIYLDKDTVENKKYEINIFKPADGFIKINLNQDNNEIYLRSENKKPINAEFHFDIYKKDRLLKKIKTPKLIINRVY